MKANRKFVQADEAVSPVIAVILMVAITVVLAATVFVLVSDIGGNTASSAPTISWTADEGQDRLTVSTASQNADWNRLTVQVDGCTSAATAQGRVGDTEGTSDNDWFNEPAMADGGALNTDGSATACGAPAPKEITGVAVKIGAGDYLEFCGTVAMTSVKVTIKDTTANSIVHTYTFTNLDVCA